MKHGSRVRDREGPPDVTAAAAPAQPPPRGDSEPHGVSAPEKLLHADND